MAYADTLRSSTYTAEDVADLIEGTLITYGSVESNTMRSTSSATNVDLTGCSITVTVGTGDKVLLLAQVVCGVNSAAATNDVTAGRLVTMSCATDGADSTFIEIPCYSLKQGSGGYEHTLNFMAIASPAVGSRTFQLRWNVSADTAYSQYQRFYAIVFQNS